MCQNTNRTNLTNLFFLQELENLRIGFLSDDNHHDDCFVLEQRFLFAENVLKARFQKHFSQRKTSSSRRNYQNHF